jgi:hypothetical protein
MDRRLAAGRSLLPGVGVTVLGVAVSALVGWAAPAVGLLGAAAVITWHPARPTGAKAEDQDLDLLAGVGTSAQHRPAQQLGEHPIDQHQRHRVIMLDHKRR